VGDGITEALIQAKGLAGAIQQGSDAALARWWRQRDVDALPGYFWGRDEGSLEPPSSGEAVRAAPLRDFHVQQLGVRRLECLPDLARLESGRRMNQRTLACDLQYSRSER
jgi:hypothetical protein